MTDAIDTLTEKERETLRLILRGHDAKSSANALDLSVHTINERLRAARRKLEVTSSREAARMLLESEGAPPEMLGDKRMGDASAADPRDISNPANGRHPGVRLPGRFTPWIIGGLIMSALLAFLLATTPFGTGGDAPAGDAASVSVSISDDAVEAAARDWLAFVDAGKSDASYEAAGSVFRNLITPENWKEASLQARAPLGDVVSREAISFQDLPAPPDGYEMVRFRTDFAGKAGAIETVTLQREGGTLKVVGYYID